MHYEKGKKLKLKQFQCNKCRCLFYTEYDTPTWDGIDFGCPFACDDGSFHVRTLYITIDEAERILDDSQYL